MFSEAGDDGTPRKGKGRGGKAVTFREGKGRPKGE